MTKPMAFDRQQLGSDGVSRAVKEIYVDGKIGSPTVISRVPPVKGLRTESYEKGSDGRHYRVFFDENGNVENIT